MADLDGRFGKLEDEKNVEEVHKFKFDESNYLDLSLPDNLSKRTINVRILPAQPGSDQIHIPVLIHSINVDKEISRSGFKKFICLEDKHLAQHDERGCPLCNRSRELFEKANELPEERIEERKAILKEAYKYKPKVSYIVRVIERGKEDEGVKFWRFNKWDNGSGVMDKLLNLCKQRDEEAKIAGLSGYDIFDLHNGKDLVLTLSKGEKTNRVEISIMDSGFQSPLSTSEEQIEAWVNDKKHWSDVYTSRPYDYLEVVVNGEVPVYDRASGKFVSKKAKAESDKRCETEAIKEVENSLINNEVNGNDDLPF